MADIQKTYQYQVYKGSVFLGVLQNVTSDFSYSQDINSNAVQIAVEVGLSADVADIPVQPLQDEAGNNLLDESGNILYEERAVDVVGSLNPRALIQEDNNLKVYEISTDNPNGKIVFDGWIEDWNALMGSNDDKITFTAISKGADLVDYLIEGASQVDVSQTTAPDTGVSFYENGDKFFGWNFFGQSWVVGVSATNLSAIAVKLAGHATIPQNVTINVYSDSLFTTLLGTATRSIVGSTPTEYAFTFDSVLSVVAGNTYYFSITTDGGSSVGLTVYYKSGSNVYANGTMYNSNYAGGSGGGGWYPVPIGSYADLSDLYFKTYYTGGATSSPLLSQDPTTMLQTIIASYNNLGGTITADPAMALTGITASYTFKVNTILEGVQKVLDLAPANWYYYVDPATGILYFKPTPTTATHKFIKGRHFNQLAIGGSVEDVRNVVYFSGGDDGTGTSTNIFRKYINTASLALRRRRLERLSDNRVTRTDTADLIVNNFLSEHATTDYNSPISIAAGTYDITTINVGDTVQAEGFGNFADALLLQIARVNKRPDGVDIQLGVLLQRQSDALIQALADLDKLQTIDNPASPS